MPLIKQAVAVKDTQDVQLYYFKPVGSMNWGMDLGGSAIEHDVTTPLVLLLHDFPSGSFSSYNNILGDIAKRLVQSGLPCLALDYRGAGDTDLYSGHFDLETAMEDIEAALRWAAQQDVYTKIIPLACGLSVPVMLEFIARHNLKWGPRQTTYNKEDSLRGLIAQSRKLYDDDSTAEIDLSMLHVISMIMFWPLLMPQKTPLLKSFRATEMYQNIGDYKTGFRGRGVTPFTGMPVRSDLITHTDEEHNKISVDLLLQLDKLDIMPLLSQIACPLLVQQGDQDISAPMEALNLVRENCTAAYLDIQIYGNAGRGLAQDNLRPHLLRLTDEFVRRFA